MNAPPTDLLGQAVALTRNRIADRSRSLSQRVQTLWSAVYAARALGSTDIVEAAFTDLARNTGLVSDLGRHGAEDAAHVIRWGTARPRPVRPGGGPMNFDDEFNRLEGLAAERRDGKTQNEGATQKDEAHPADNGVQLDDFYAYMPQHKYIFTPTREVWPASSVDARLPNVGTEKASRWLDQNRAVEQMTWAPGETTVIEHRLIADGGWIPRTGCSVFNLYRAPIIEPVSGSAAPWLDHVKRLYGSDADHVINWLAQRVQRPHEKINHALVLGRQTGHREGYVCWNRSNVRSAHGISPRCRRSRCSGGSTASQISHPARERGARPRRLRPLRLLRTHEEPTRPRRRTYSASTRRTCASTASQLSPASSSRPTTSTDGIYLPADDRRHFVAGPHLDRTTSRPILESALGLVCQRW